MTVQEQIKQLAEVAATHNSQIACIDRQLESIVASLKATGENIDKLTGVVGSLAASVVAHDEQIASMVREWQAYLRRLPPQ